MPSSSSVRCLLAALWGCAVLVVPAARADVIDLTNQSRSRTSRDPAGLLVRLEGGDAYAPAGELGLTLSYLNLDSLFEIEGSGGYGAPGAQIGVSLRKLFGQGGNFFVSELGLAYNNRERRGVDLANNRAGSKAWTNFAIGFEHRQGNIGISLTGGLALTSLSTPALLIHGGVGFGL